MCILVVIYVIHNVLHVPLLAPQRVPKATEERRAAKGSWVSG